MSEPTVAADAIASAAARFDRTEIRRVDEDEAAERRSRFVSFIIVRAPTRNLKQRPLQNRVPSFKCWRSTDANEEMSPRLARRSTRSRSNLSTPATHGTNLASPRLGPQAES